MESRQIAGKEETERAGREQAESRQRAGRVQAVSRPPAVLRRRIDDRAFGEREEGARPSAEGGFRKRAMAGGVQQKWTSAGELIRVKTKLRTQRNGKGHKQTERQNKENSSELTRKRLL